MDITATISANVVTGHGISMLAIIKDLLKIAKFRKINQSEIARKAGIRQATISDYVNHKKDISIVTYEKIFNSTMKMCQEETASENPFVKNQEQENPFIQNNETKIRFWAKQLANKPLSENKLVENVQWLIRKLNE
jgi:transcriptional regulator with XRE-family HTH domain